MRNNYWKVPEVHVKKFQGFFQALQFLICNFNFAKFLLILTFWISSPLILLFCSASKSLTLISSFEVLGINRLYIK